MNDMNPCKICHGSLIEHLEFGGEIECRCVDSRAAVVEAHYRQVAQIRDAVDAGESIDLTSIADGHTGDVW